jgi:hypothetical protein
MKSEPVMRVMKMIKDDEKKRQRKEKTVCTVIRLICMMNMMKAKKVPDKERLPCTGTKLSSYLSRSIFPVFFSPADSNR